MFSVPRDSAVSNFQSWFNGAPDWMGSTKIWIVVTLFSICLTVRVWFFWPKSKNEILADEISKLSKGIQVMLSDYTQRLQKTNWNPHLGGNVHERRNAKFLEKQELEAEIVAKFQRDFKHDALEKMKKAYLVLKMDDVDFDLKTQSLSSEFFIDEFAKHLLSISQKLRK